MTVPSPDSLRDQLETSLGAAYTIERELGGGGMSRVFVAHETRFERRVVIKVLSPELAAGLSVERFEREIALAAQLQQANIVPVLTAGDCAGLPYYVMPFVDGESLRARMTRGETPPSEAIAILRDILRALAYAHAHGVVHRDIKPENVLLSGGTAVVTDFGIAKAVSASKTKAPGGTLTVVGTSLGTPAYMAPEQAAGDDIDGRADLYAWAVIAYELLSGRHVFSGKVTAQQLMAAHIAETPKRLDVSGVPLAVTALVMRCLAKDPSGRPESATAILTSLDASVASGAHVTSSRSKGRIIAAGTAIAAIALVAWLLVGRGRSTSAGNADTTPIATLAVLPFENEGGNSADEYFSDGMTDELAHALSRLPSLRVAGRTSAYAYKGRHARAQEVGHALNVAAVVTGTVRRSGARVRVSTELTGVSDGLLIWSGTYDSETNDVFRVQDSVTRAIVLAIAPALRGQHDATSLAASSRGTTDQAAYDYYLRGQHLWAMRNSQNITQAGEFFRKAIARDSNFARAYAGLAMVSAVLSVYIPTIGADSAYALATPAAHKALALDSAVADAHFALGTALFHLTRYDEAAEQYRAALLRDPNNVSGHSWLGDVLTIQGRRDEGLAEHRRASEIDPLSAPAAGAVCENLNWMRRFAEAAQLCGRFLGKDGSAEQVAAPLATAFIYSGKADSAVLVLENTTRHLDQPRPDVLTLLAQSYAAAGRWADADRVRARLRASHTRSASVNDVIVGLAYGETEPLLAMLDGGPNETALVDISALSCTPQSDQIRSDPRFIAASKRHGIPACPFNTPSPFTRARH